MLTKLNANYFCQNTKKIQYSKLLNICKNIQMHFFKLHGVQFNKCSYHAFSNYGVKMKIYGEIRKKIKQFKSLRTWRYSTDQISMDFGISNYNKIHIL